MKYLQLVLNALYLVRERNVDMKLLVVIWDQSLWAFIIYRNGQVFLYSLWVGPKPLAIPVLRRLRRAFLLKGDIASSEIRNEAGDILEAAEPFGGGVSLHTRCDMSK